MSNICIDKEFNNTVTSDKGQVSQNLLNCSASWKNTSFMSTKRLCDMQWCLMTTQTCYKRCYCRGNERPSVPQIALNNKSCLCQTLTPQGRMDTEEAKHLTSMLYMKKPANDVMVTDHKLHHAAGKMISDMLGICAGTFRSQSPQDCARYQVTPVVS